MKQKLKKLFAYYRPYKGLFYSDRFFAILGAVVTLVIPLVIRYITNEVVYFAPAKARESILMLGSLMVALVLLEIFCNFYIAYFGHIMGAKMEADMRRDIFGHYQKLTFAFYDNQKVGHLRNVCHHTVSANVFSDRKCNLRAVPAKLSGFQKLS